MGDLHGDLLALLLLVHLPARAVRRVTEQRIQDAVVLLEVLGNIGRNAAVPVVAATVDVRDASEFLELSPEVVERSVVHRYLHVRRCTSKHQPSSRQEPVVADRTGAIAGLQLREVSVRDRRVGLGSRLDIEIDLDPGLGAAWLNLENTESQDALSVADG